MIISVTISNSISLTAQSDPTNIACLPGMAIAVLNSLINTPFTEYAVDKWNYLRDNGFPLTSERYDPAVSDLSRGLCILGPTGAIPFKILSASHRVLASHTIGGMPTLGSSIYTGGSYQVYPLNSVPKEAAIPLFAKPVGVVTIAGLEDRTQSSTGLTQFAVPLDLNSAIAPNGSFQEQLGFITKDRYLGQNDPAITPNFLACWEYSSTTREMIPASVGNNPIVGASISITPSFMPFAMQVAARLGNDGTTQYTEFDSALVESTFTIEINDTTPDSATDIYAMLSVPYNNSSIYANVLSGELTLGSPDTKVYFGYSVSGNFASGVKTYSVNIDKALAIGNTTTLASVNGPVGTFIPQTGYLAPLNSNYASSISVSIAANSENSVITAPVMA